MKTRKDMSVNTSKDMSANTSKEIQPLYLLTGLDGCISLLVFIDMSLLVFTDMSLLVLMVVPYNHQDQ